MRARGSTTALGDKVWEAICHEIKGSKSQAPFFRHGLLKSALTGMHMSAAEVKRVFSNTSMVGKALKADGLMFELRGLISSHINVDDQNLVNVFAVVDSNLVAHVMGLSVHAEEKKYKALEGIVHDAVSILSGIIGVQIDSPWQGHAESVPHYCIGKFCQARRSPGRIEFGWIHEDRRGDSGGHADEGGLLCSPSQRQNGVRDSRNRHRCEAEEPGTVGP